MLSDVLKCSLEVLLVCAFFTGSDARATNNAGNSDAFSSASSNTYAGAVASAGTGAYALNGANAFTGAFAGTGHFPGVYERHKEIPSYDNINFPHDNDANRGVKSLSHHRATKSEGHDYNKDGDGCSKCKWENDDYWERDETEEEGNENDRDECDDSDDGQYKPDKTHLHGGSGREHTFGSNLSGVHKTGLTGVYSDDVKEGIKGDKLDGPFRVTNFPVNTGYAGSASSYASTPKLKSSWNTPFASTSKPEYGGVTANTFVTMPSYGLETGWNKRTTLASSGYALKLAWGSEHGNTFGGSFGTTSNPTWNIGFGGTPATAGFFSSQNPGSSWNTNHDNTLVGSYGTTPKSGTNWNTVAPDSGFSTSQKPWSNAHDSTPVGSYGTTLKSEPGWNSGSTPKTGHSFSHKPAPNWNGDYGNTPAGSFETMSKPVLSWNTGLGISTARFPSSQNPVPNWNADCDNTPTGHFGTTSKPGSNWNTGYDTPTAESPPTQKPVAPWNTGHDNIFVKSSGTTSKPGQNQNIGFNGKPGTNWNPSQGITSFGTFGCTRPDSNCNLGKQGPVKVGATPFENAFVKSDEFSSSFSPGTSYRGSSMFLLNSSKGPNGNQNGPYGQFETAGGIPSDVSRPWSGITPKSVGKGNLFLDSSWSTPKPGGINANNDRNVMSFDQENIKSFKENPFLNNNKRRGNIEFNIDEQLIPLGGRKSEENNLFGAPSRNGSSDSNGPLYGEPARSPESRAPGIDGNGDIKSDLYSGRVSPQSGNSGISYPAGSNRQSTDSLQCKFGIFGCETLGSGSYAATKDGKHSGEVHGGVSGNIEAGIGNLGNVNSGPGESGNSRTRIGPVPGNYGGGFNIGASQPGSAGNNLAGSVGGVHAEAYAGSFSSVQASSSNFANARSFSFSGTKGHGDNFGQANSGSWSSSEAQNQGGLNSWTSSGASAFTSSAGSWPGNHPVDVKG